jgi:RNA polymerase sigma-70 factor (ECF subfamily)
MESIRCAMASDATDAADAPEHLPLVNAAREGNRFAFQQLVTMFEQKIFRMIYYRTRSRLDAEDMCQEVFLKAYRHLKRLKEPARFESWLYRIAANRVNDHFRRKKFRALFSALPENDHDLDLAPDRDEPLPVEEKLARAAFWRRVQQMLDGLSRMEREVFLLRFLDELGIKEIAEVLDKSESTVKTHLYRALEKFKGDKAFRDFLKEAAS